MDRADIRIKIFENKLPLFMALYYLYGCSLGLIADVFGRRRALIFSLFLLALSGIGEAFTRNFLIFCIFTFLRTMGIHGSFLTALLLNMEMEHPKMQNRDH